MCIVQSCLFTVCGHQKDVFQKKCSLLQYHPLGQKSEIDGKTRYYTSCPIAVFQIDHPFKDSKICYTCEYVRPARFMLEKAAEMKARKNQQAKSEIVRESMLPKLTSKIPLSSAKARAIVAASKVSSKEDNLKIFLDESNTTFGLTSEANFNDKLSTDVTFDDIRQLILEMKAQNANTMEGAATTRSSEEKSSIQTPNEDTTGAISDLAVNPTVTSTSPPVIEEVDDDGYFNIGSDDEWSVVDENDIFERSQVLV